MTSTRQIGKTYIIRKFIQEYYQNFVEINFITTSFVAEIFPGNLDANTIILKLTAFVGKSLELGKTVVFFDEIQEYPKARTVIKFLVEDGRFDHIL